MPVGDTPAAGGGAACPGGSIPRGVSPAELLREIRARLLAVAGVEPALLLVHVLPPPPSFALVLARNDRPRARFATYRNIPALVKGVVGDVVFADVFPDLL